jgi:23S rRNA U2552 (ribose-2'-O)-methylase RlmE/FtsJ
MKQIYTIRVPKRERNVFLTQPKWVTTHHAGEKGYWSTQVMKSKHKMGIPLYQRNWQKYKEYVNKYECVYNPKYQFSNQNIALCAPLSRSYFKLWEIVTDFKLLAHADKDAITTAHLAEGPGGFIESVCDYRRQHASEDCAKRDTYHGITLLTHQNDDVPNWKKARQLMDTYSQIEVHTGADNTGDLYNVDNIHAFVRDVGRHSCALVTGDGGMDYSHNYAKQEELSQRLILAQIYASLLLVQPKKHVVCKLFETHEQFTQELLWIVSLCFDVVHVMKPYTSRVANSERYVVACGFRECSQEIEHYLRDLLQNWKPSMFLESIFSKPMPLPFTKSMYTYSEWHSKQQMMCISKCYRLIESNRASSATKSSELSLIRQQQEQFAKQWCKRYKIPYKK